MKNLKLFDGRRDRLRALRAAHVILRDAAGRVDGIDTGFRILVNAALYLKSPKAHKKVKTNRAFEEFMHDWTERNRKAVTRGH